MREQFKQCALGVQYGMGPWSLAVRLGATIRQSGQLIQMHKETYANYWRWSDEVLRQARTEGELTAVLGWKLNGCKRGKSRSVRNFLLQANGAEMLRVACCLLTEAGVRVCAPVHDALVIEAPEGEIEGAVACAREGMERASEAVLLDFPLRTETKVILHPTRYADPRGKFMWDAVGQLLGVEAVRCA